MAFRLSKYFSDPDNTLRFKRSNWIIETVVYLFIVLFLYTAVAKLTAFHRFKYQLAHDPFISSYASIVGWILPFVELGIAGMLFFDRSKLLGFFGAFSLMVLFTAYVAIMLASGVALPCTCGGVISSMSWKAHLVFNGALCGLSSIAIYLLVRKRS